MAHIVFPIVLGQADKHKTYTARLLPECGNSDPKIIDSQVSYEPVDLSRPRSGSYGQGSELHAVGFRGEDCRSGLRGINSCI